MKVAQHIGSLDFLFPKEYTDTLKCFQYEAPRSSLVNVRYVIESETGRTMSELFYEFVEEPIGSASLAQVLLNYIRKKYLMLLEGELNNML